MKGQPIHVAKILERPTVVQSCRLPQWVTHHWSHWGIGLSGSLTLGNFNKSRHRGLLFWLSLRFGPDPRWDTKRAVQSCFRFSQLNSPKLMHKSSYSVCGHLGFFSVLRGLFSGWIVSRRLGAAEPWISQMRFLAFHCGQVLNRKGSLAQIMRWFWLLFLGHL